MGLKPVVILICIMVVAVLAQDQSRGPQVEAATADATESLKREVIATHITPDLTVADIIDRAEGGDEFNKTISSAQQLGGARWLGDQAVQVRLSIDGSQVAKMLVRIAQAKPGRSPIPAEALERRLRDWSDRIFSATGTSLGAADITHLRPPASDRSWWCVSDGDRRQALLAARDNAIAHILESVKPIELPTGKTIAQALSDQAANQAIVGWLSKQPVKSVQFSNDQTVHLTLDVTPEGLWPQLRLALDRQKQIAPTTQADWDNLREQVVSRMGSASGIGMVRANPQPAAAGAALPAQAPPWANQQAEAQATAPDHGGRLHTARNAEDLALERLRRQIEDLPLSPGVTIAVASQHDPRIEKAVTKALRRAKPFQVDYGANGSATVHVALHLSDLWGDISGQ
jgi:hypothetical protein